MLHCRPFSTPVCRGHTAVGSFSEMLTLARLLDGCSFTEFLVSVERFHMRNFIETKDSRLYPHFVSPADHSAVRQKRFSQCIPAHQ